MLKTLTALAVLAFATTVSGGILLASDDPIAARQALMKEQSRAARLAGNMVKGEAPYDPEAAAQAAATIAANAEKVPSLFPEGTDTGFDTEAHPAIWENKAGFEAIAAKLAEDARAAQQAAAQGLESFRAAFAAMANNCRSCHEEYRVKD